MPHKFIPLLVSCQSGVTAFMLASEERHTQVLKLLHKKGADRKLTTTVSVDQLDHHSHLLAS